MSNLGHRHEFEEFTLLDSTGEGSQAATARISMNVHKAWPKLYKECASML